MEHTLQLVTGSKMISLLNGFSEYNQIAMAKEDQIKIAFTTLWGMFAYERMPFGLINASANFQRAMDLAFGDLKDKIIVVYLDDLTIFSDKREDHFSHLVEVFKRCRYHKISLNPKKTICSDGRQATWPHRFQRGD